MMDRQVVSQSCAPRLGPRAHVFSLTRMLNILRSCMEPESAPQRNVAPVHDVH